MAHGRLDADRSPTFGREHLDEVEQAVGVVEFRVTVRAPTVDPLRNPSQRGDLGCHFRAREQPAEPGLRALTQLDLDHPYLRMGIDDIAESRELEPALGIATTEVPGTDLPDEIPTVKVVGTHPTFTRSLEASGVSAPRLSDSIAWAPSAP